MDLNEAIEQVFNELMLLSDEEFNKKMEESENGDVFKFLTDLNEFSKSKEYCEIINRLIPR